MRILITGAGGFVAPHAGEALRARGHEVVWTGRGGDNGGFAADLANPDEARALLAETRPQAILHLAAQSSPSESWNAPEETFRSNVAATCQLLRAAHGTSVRRFLYISSADVYGEPPEKNSVTEQTPLAPRTPYGVSKAAAEMSARLYCERAGIEWVILRPFSHTGPGQTPRFVVPAFAEQVARVEAGEVNILRHGDLEAKRDFLDVRDVAQAYALALEQAPAGSILNVCSGQSIQVAELLRMLTSMAECAIPTETDPARIRGERARDLRGDCSALREATGWDRTIPLEQTLRDVLDEQRHRVRGGARSESRPAR